MEPDRNPDDSMLNSADADPSRGVSTPSRVLTPAPTEHLTELEAAGLREKADDTDALGSDDI